MDKNKTKTLLCSLLLPLWLRRSGLVSLPCLRKPINMGSSEVMKEKIKNERRELPLLPYTIFSLAFSFPVLFKYFQPGAFSSSFPPEATCSNLTCLIMKGVLVVSKLLPADYKVSCQKWSRTLNNVKSERLDLHQRTRSINVKILEPCKKVENSNTIYQHLPSRFPTFKKYHEFLVPFYHKHPSLYSRTLNHHRSHNDHNASFSVTFL